MNYIGFGIFGNEIEIVVNMQKKNMETKQI